MGVPPERIGTVHYGVDEAGFHPPDAAAEPRTILFVGALQEHKGALMLLQALRHLRQPCQGRALDDQPRSLLRRGFRAGAGRRTRPRFPYHRTCARHARPAALGAVLPIGDRVRDAVLGIGVRAGQSGGARLRDAGRRFPRRRLPRSHSRRRQRFPGSPGDPAALAAGLERVLDDPALRARLGAEGRATILREFTWKRVGEKLEAHYARLAGSKTPA
jgi:glycosyltransferase involved in cell wall biosynthesis